MNPRRPSRYSHTLVRSPNDDHRNPRIYLLMRDIIAKSAIIGIIFMCCCKTPEPTPDGKGFKIERNYKCDPNDENQSIIICPNLSGQEALDTADELEETFIKRK